jgi:hypothetical protein
MMRLLFEVEVVDPPILKTGCRFKLLKILEMVTAPLQGSARAAASSRVACSFFDPTRLSRANAVPSSDFADHAGAFDRECH